MGSFFAGVTSLGYPRSSHLCVVPSLSPCGWPVSRGINIHIISVTSIYHMDVSVSFLLGLVPVSHFPLWIAPLHTLSSGSVTRSHRGSIVALFAFCL